MENYECVEASRNEEVFKKYRIHLVLRAGSANLNAKA
jgi:hypothetical protein